MKRIILKSLTMRNFKGERERTSHFNSRSTTIAGKNGVGKSRHFDAFLWLLFGKDALDRKDYEIKTRLSSGEELHKVDCMVEGVLFVDEEEITLRRVLSEKWRKPRGCAEQVYDGNETLCFWNNVPVSVGEYDAKVRGIIDASLFKMLTNPLFFANMAWKSQRDMLFELAGEISDADIAKDNVSFVDLLDKMSGKSFAEFKAENNAKKKRLKDELNEIQPRIDQTMAVIPQESTSISELQELIDDVSARILDVEGKMELHTKAKLSQDDAQQEKRERLTELKNAQSKLVFDTNNEIRKQAYAEYAESQNKAYEANAKRRALQAEIDAIVTSIAECDAITKREEASISDMLRRRVEFRQRLDNLRDEWYTISASTYNGDTTCHYCGQPLPAEILAKAKEKFDADKKERLALNGREGKELSDRLKEIEKEEGKCDQRALAAKQEKIDATSLLKEKKIQLEAMAEAKAIMPEIKEVEGKDLPQWLEMQKEIEEIESELTPCVVQSDVDEVELGLKDKKAGLDKQREDLLKRLQDAQNVERGHTIVNELELKGKSLAQQIANIERLVITMEDFTKKKVEEVEKRINGLFTIVTFKLYDNTIEGNLIETCIPMVDGVPYGSANKASQINAGLDIINALSKFYGVSAPIFLDNSESILAPIQTDAQMIHLKVTNDDNLTIY